MSTIQTTLCVTPRRWSATLVTTIGALVAVGVAVLFLTLSGPSHRNPATASHPAQTYAPLIQYRGTGAPPATVNPHTDQTHDGAVVDPETGQIHGGAVPSPAGAAGAQTKTAASPRSRKSYGAVP
jgi:hypothetical protein